jgi:Transmembrane protein 18
VVLLISIFALRGSQYFLGTVFLLLSELLRPSIAWSTHRLALNVLKLLSTAFPQEGTSKLHRVDCSPYCCGCAVGVIYNAERINAALAQEWQRFATQNYFDPNGIFISALVSGPLLFLMFVILVRA